MIELRPKSSLGGGDHGWLLTRHHFSFADYQDPARVHWGSLRVWNDDEIAPNTGFAPHSHANMEIITYVRQGAITHEDSLGNKGRTVAGDVQVMSAGTGIRHSEYNREAVTTKIFQLWIIPTKQGDPPAWGTQSFPKADRAGQFAILASGHGEAGALPIRTDAKVLGLTLAAGQQATYTPAPGRHLYLVPATGTVQVNDATLHEGDGAAIAEETALTLKAVTQSELILVDSA